MPCEIVRGLTDQFEVKIVHVFELVYDRGKHILGNIEFPAKTRKPLSRSTIPVRALTSRDFQRLMLARNADARHQWRGATIRPQRTGLLAIPAAVGLRP